jgi:uncharacterized protein (TIRG00374 family)
MKKRSYLKYIFHTIIIIGVIVAGIKYLNGDEVSHAFRTFNYWYAPLILALSLGYFLLKSWRFVVLMRPVSDLPWLTIMKGYLAGQAVALLPGGVAARAGLMEQAGEDVGKSSVPVAFNSLLDQFFLIMGALVAALWFEEVRFTVFALLGVILALGVALAIPALRERVIDLCAWTANKCNIRAEWRQFLRAVPEVASFRTLSIAMALTIVAFTFQIVALELALRGMDSPLPVYKVFMAFVIPTILGRIIPTPGGFGVTEAGMVGFLISISEISSATAAAAVAVFRVGTIVFEVLVGAVIYFFVWRGEKEADEASMPVDETNANFRSEPEKSLAGSSNL